MSDFLRVFLNSRSLRAVTREITLEQLNEGFEKLQQIVDDRRSQEAIIQRKDEERRKKIEEYKALLASEGLDLTDLISGSVDQPIKAKRAPRAPKYQFMRNGQLQTWTGQGRTPVEIQKQLNEGKNLEDFLIR